MRAVSLLDVSAYLPENRVPAACYACYTESAEDAAGVMFKAPPSRHHVAPNETAADMAASSAKHAPGTIRRTWPHKGGLYAPSPRESTNDIRTRSTSAAISSVRVSR